MAEGFCEFSSCRFPRQPDTVELALTPLCPAKHCREAGRGGNLGAYAASNHPNLPATPPGYASY
jgi:hypothetical protein